MSNKQEPFPIHAYSAWNDTSRNEAPQEVLSEDHPSISYLSDYSDKFPLVDEFGKLFNENMVNWVYWSRLLLSFAIFSVSVVCMALVQIIGDQFYTPLPPLRDMVHTLLPQPFPPIQAVNIVELLLTAFGLSVVVVFTNRHMRFLLLTRTALLISICYWIRSVAVIVTIVPDPLPNCYPIQIHSAMDVMIAVVELISGHRFSCTDVIVSGHSIMICVIWLVFCLYFPRREWMVVLVSLYCLFNAIICVTSHMHYTIDVFLAIVLTVGVTYVYHACLDYEVEGIKRSLVFARMETKDYIPHICSGHCGVTEFFLFRKIAPAVSWCEALPLRIVIGARFYKARLENSLRWKNSFPNDSYMSLLPGYPDYGTDHPVFFLNYLLKCGYMGAGDVEMPSFCNSRQG